MARQRKKHHFWRNLLILIVLFGIYLYWGNRSIETDEGDIHLRRAACGL